MSFDQRSLHDRVFFPFATERASQVQAAGLRFVYYTRAAVAHDIVKSRQWWLRNALVMNDFSEVGHGFEYLRSAYDRAPGQAINSALGEMFPGLPGAVANMVNGLLPIIRNDTYLACFSEHLPEEDARGRLSMWRAYGGESGVALVINGGVMHSASTVLGVYSSPVFYGTQSAFDEQLFAIARNIKAESATLSALGYQALHEIMISVLRAAILCTKHPAFSEEREWRAVGSPTIYSTPRMRLAVEVIGGVPQQVVKLDLTDSPQDGLMGLELPKLIDRVIIGPCKYPQVTQYAFFRLLSDAGVPNPESRVVIADVPLRHDA